MKIKDALYFKASEEYQGYCTFCDELTRGETEPDARGYECPKCGNFTVMGLEEALMQDKIEFEE